MAWKKSSAGLLLAASLVAAPLERFETVEPHMGTLVRITLYAPDSDSARKGFAAAFERIRALDETLSDYKATSELSRLRAGAPIPVSEDLFRLLSAAQDLARETRGAFDITLGAAIRVWREARRAHRLPAAEERRLALQRCGYRYLKLDPRRRAVQILQPGLQLDPGGIAKGFAASEALTVLRARGLPRSLVAVSGDLAIGDAPPDRAGWRVQVDRPLLLHNCAVSTSGDTEQYVEIGGVRYSHIIDPKTGLGLTTRIRVTVLARDGATADGLATALSVLTPSEGRKVALRHHARVWYSASRSLRVAGAGGASAFDTIRERQPDGGAITSISHP